ncbi:MAG: class I SAM-dependent methyltransferase [Deltaproteobacteria bacterium]|nr:class I SAM-dependent methyltransferase [Deltaproteobacteria bacterium]
MSEQDRVRWNRRYAETELEDDPPSLLVELLERWPIEGTALDIAGGTGQAAAFLTSAGHDVVLVDISGVALELARQRSVGPGRLTLLESDLEAQPLPEGPFDLIVCSNFLDRRVLEQVPARLRPNGLFFFIHPTVRNLERNPKPSRRFLLEEGEAASLLATTLELLEVAESWRAGRHLMQLVGRRT